MELYFLPSADEKPFVYTGFVAQYYFLSHFLCNNLPNTANTPKSSLLRRRISIVDKKLAERERCCERVRSVVLIYHQPRRR